MKEKTNGNITLPKRMTKLLSRQKPKSLPEEYSSPVEDRHHKWNDKYNYLFCEKNK